MDPFSIVAAVGSFMVSERLLPPKSLLIAGMSFLFVYDMFIYQHDYASLRVYRGPGLLAFTFCCIAYSLRTWRRNGIACDELLFLPGTIYAERFQENYTANSTLENFRKNIPKNTSKSNLASNTVNVDEIVDIEMTDMIIDNSLTDNETIEISLSLDEEIEETKDNEGYGFTYSPSAPSVFGASLDLAFPVLFNFHLFTEAKRSISKPDDAEASSDYVIANILPLIFLTVLYFRSIIPPTSRKRFWSILCYIISSPYYKIIFRDDVVGDLITSFVRSIQDFIFTFFYYYTVTRSVLYPSMYSLDKTSEYLEVNWLLHCIVLPVIAIAPLWWKFLQSLRKYYDDASRMHLCHAFKYLTSSMIVFYSLTHPLQDRSIWWFLGFGAVTLYQIYCDVFLDWELFVFKPTTASPSTENQHYYYYPVNNASFLSSPINYCIYRFILQPMYNIRYTVLHLYDSLEIRPQKHVFKNHPKWYYIIFWFNCITRCCWMLNFLPTHYIDTNNNNMIVRTFSKDFNAYLGMLVSVFEIIRRCLWCILVVELQSIKLTDTSYNNANTTHQILSYLFSPMISNLHNKFSLVFSSYKYKEITIEDDETSDCNDDSSVRSMKSLNIIMVGEQSSPLPSKKSVIEDMSAVHIHSMPVTSRKRLLLLFELSCWVGVYIYFGYLALSH